MLRSDTFGYPNDFTLSIRVRWAPNRRVLLPGHIVLNLQNMLRDRVINPSVNITELHFTEHNAVAVRKWTAASVCSLGDRAKELERPQRFQQSRNHQRTDAF